MLFLSETGKTILLKNKISQKLYVLSKHKKNLSSLCVYNSSVDAAIVCFY